MMFDKSQLQQLYQYCIALTNHPDNAHDLLQTAVEKWLRSSQYGDTSPAYIRKIIRNQFIDECRRKKIIAFETLPQSVPAALKEDTLEQTVIDEDLTQKLMLQLNAAEREVLYLWAVLEYTAAEIADELDISRGTILSRLYRVKKKAQSIMDEMDDGLFQRGVS